MASLSGVFNLQEFTDLGDLGASYRLYTYAPGTTALKVAYTDAAGTIPHTYTPDGLGGQYIALNVRGELPAPLFLSDGGYDIALKSIAGVTVWTRRATGGSDYASDALVDLSNSTDGSKGAGQIGFDDDLAYPAGSLGNWLSSLTKDGGAGFVGFKQTGTGAQLRNLLSRGQDTVSVFDFMTAAQIADVKARTYGIDVSGAIMAALNSRANGADVFFPDGGYRISQTINVFRKGRMRGACLSETADRNPTVRFFKSATLNGPAILFAQDSAGFVMEGIELDGENGNGGDGIVGWTNSITLRNVSVYRMGRDNVRFGKDGFGANANNWKWDRVVSNLAKRHNFHLNDKYDPTLTGTIASGSQTFTASGAFFEASAVGYPLTVVGAGVAGADLTATITGYISATQVTLSAPASTSVTTSEFWSIPDVNAGEASQPTGNQALSNGFYLQNAHLNTFVGIHAELNGAYGLQLGKLTRFDNFFGGDLAEGNVVDFVCDAGSDGCALWGVAYTTGADNSGRCSIFAVGKGTGTPTVMFGGSSAGVTYGARYLEWTRVGNRIQGSLSVTLTNKGSGSGVMQITGLPFNTKNVGVNGSSVVFGASNFTGLGGALAAFVATNTATINVVQSSATGLTDVTSANATNSTRIELSFDYIVPG